MHLSVSRGPRCPKMARTLILEFTGAAYRRPGHRSAGRSDPYVNGLFDYFAGSNRNTASRIVALLIRVERHSGENCRFEGHHYSE